MTDLPPVLTIEDAATYLRRSVKTIRRRIEAGQIRTYREGREHRIRREWLLAYEAACINGEEVAALEVQRPAHRIFHAKGRSVQSTTQARSL